MIMIYNVPLSVKRICATLLCKIKNMFPTVELWQFLAGWWFVIYLIYSISCWELLRMVRWSELDNKSIIFLLNKYGMPLQFSEYNPWDLERTPKLMKTKPPFLSHPTLKFLIMISCIISLLTSQLRWYICQNILFLKLHYLNLVINSWKQLISKSLFFTRSIKLLF